MKKVILLLPVVCLFLSGCGESSNTTYSQFDSLSEAKSGAEVYVKSDSQNSMYVFVNSVDGVEIRTPLSDGTGYSNKDKLILTPGKHEVVSHLYYYHDGMQKFVNSPRATMQFECNAGDKLILYRGSNSKGQIAPIIYDNDTLETLAAAEYESAN